MAEKTKTYQKVKFPYEIISKGSKEFLKSVPAKDRKGLLYRWVIEQPDAKWSLDSENQFISEYSKSEILAASISLYNLGMDFRINYLNPYPENPMTSISITLPDREKIEKVFGIFEAFYSEFVEKIRDTNTDNIFQIAPRYNYEKILPSLFVDKKLLVDLERYILQRCGQLDVRKKQVPAYAGTIIDSSGTLSLPSIESYPREIFDNETETITLSYGETYENIRIHLRFAKNRNSSEIEISYKGENAREVVESIKVGIYQCLKDSKTWNFIYHPHEAVFTLLIYSLLFVLGITIYNAVKTAIWSQQGLSAILFLFTYFVAPSFKPYTTFETRQNMIIRKWSGWIVESLLGILLIWLIASLFPTLIP